MMTIVCTAPCVKLAAQTPGTPLVVANFADRGEGEAAEASPTEKADAATSRAPWEMTAAEEDGKGANLDSPAAAGDGGDGGTAMPTAAAAASAEGATANAANPTAAPLPASPEADLSAPAPTVPADSADGTAPMSEARRTMLGEAPEADDEGARMGRFRLRCEAVANTYLLSRRESEVLYYLARGYKSASIQQQLYISEGTAKTHIRHIYRKLNVHNQQELILLIDEVEL